MSQASDQKSGGAATAEGEALVSSAGYRIPGVPEDSAGAKRRERLAAARADEITVADHPAWERLSSAIRRQVRACVELGADASTLEHLVDRAETLAEALEAEASGKRFGLVEAGWRGVGDDMNYLPFSPIMGRLNPASYGLRVRREGQHAVGRLVLDETAEGAIGLAHGGVISGIWDEVLAAANTLHETGGPTGSLKIRYRRPTPLFEPLEYRAWVERIDERKVLVHGSCRIVGRDDVLTDAEGIFVRLRIPGIDWHHKDQKRDASSD